MRECTRCKNEKLPEDFYSNSYSLKCKQCIRECVKLNSELVGNKYDFSEKGVIRVLYKTMKRHQKIRGFSDIPFTKDEFKYWLYNNTSYKDLWDTWKDNGNPTQLKPSVDRLNDYKGYSFDNMRMVVYKENREHQVNDRLKGMSKSGEVCHRIIKLTKGGVEVKRYVSYQEVRREEGYCVHYAIKKGQPCKRGFMWKDLGNNK